MKRFLLSLIFVLSFLLSASALKSPIKFGKVEMSDLEMEVYDPDTSAAAVVLCDYGIFESQTFQFRRIIRIKILKKEGLYWSNRSFPGYDKTDVRGKTFNLENGEIVVDKLKNESVFRERITEDHYRLRVAMPNVKVGSVIDIEFSFLGIPYIWYFQQEIPVKWSELRLENSPYVDFRKNMFGFESLDISTDWRWVATEVPAFKEEAYISSKENYITKFEFDILSINFPGYFYESFTTSWDAVAKHLDESVYFGKALNGNIFLSKLAKSIESYYINPLDRLKAAYDSIQKIKWDEKERLYISTPDLMYQIYKREIGNSADINLLLVSLLRKMAITAYPVAMSTRQNGLLPYYPTENKLNYTIAYAKIGAETYLLDATEDLLPYDILPYRCLNYRALLVQDEKGFPIDIEVSAKKKEFSLYTLNLNDDLTLTGQLECSKADYSAFDFRKDYEKYNSKEDFLENLESEYPGLRVKDFSIENLEDVNLPIKDKYEIEIKNLITGINDMIYINPLLFHSMKENPFLMDERKYPVDFAVTQDKTIMFQYTIPEGYEVVELPEPALFRMPDNSARLVYNIKQLGNNITVTYKYSRNKSIYTSKEYPNLKEFYNQIIKKHAETIILKKTTT